MKIFKRENIFLKIRCLCAEGVDITDLCLELELGIEFSQEKGNAWVWSCQQQRKFPGDLSRHDL